MARNLFTAFIKWTPSFYFKEPKIFRFIMYLKWTSAFISWRWYQDFQREMKCRWTCASEHLFWTFTFISRNSDAALAFLSRNELRTSRFISWFNVIPYLLCYSYLFALVCGLFAVENSGGCRAAGRAYAFFHS